MPLSDDSPSYFARVNFREENDRFGILQPDRLQHMYIVGRSGCGKTSLLEILMKQDGMAKRGFAYFDPHGDSIRLMASYLKGIHSNPVTFIDLTNPDITLGYNPLRKVHPSKHSLVTSSILEIFKRNWKSAWGLKLEHILRQVIRTLLFQEQASFADISKILLDSSYRTTCICNIKEDDELRRFWEKEFPQYKVASDLLPVLNKVGAFLAHPIAKRILVENKTQVSFRSIMDKGHIVLVNLSRGAVGTDTANILGSLLLVSLASAAFSRIDTLENERKPFFVYLDEFQTISGTDLLSELLSQVRKFKLGLNLANQFLNQLDPEVRDAVLGNVGTLISFRCGIQDARILEKEFYPVFKSTDFVSLANFEIYLRLLINGRPSQAFSAVTIKEL